VRSVHLAGAGDGRRDFERVEADAGAVLPAHHHPGVEELFVQQGSCAVEGRTMRAGDYHRAAGGTRHAATVAGTDGCALLVATRAPVRTTGA
jgi:anti-sigma factor ChrR (cupin superfamily)